MVPYYLLIFLTDTRKDFCIHVETGPHLQKHFTFHVLGKEFYKCRNVIGETQIVHVEFGGIPKTPLTTKNTHSLVPHRQRDPHTPC